MLRQSLGVSRLLVAMRLYCQPLERAMDQAPPVPSPPDSFPKRRVFPVVAIGASAGGLPALTTLLGALPGTLEAALVVVTHTAPDTKSHLAELLASVTALPVRELTGAEPVATGMIYVLPAGHDVVIRGGILTLAPREDAPQHRPIDRFMTSLARDLGAAAVGVILSGAGSDGSLGLREIHAAGGLVIVQQPETALHDGMPSNAMRTGLVDKVLPIEAMGAYLAQTLPDLYRDRPVEAFDPTTPETRAALDSILGLLQEQTGHDLTGYKPSTLLRRIHRRVLLAGLADMPSYVAKLMETPEERTRILGDLLIGVTAFFRDDAAFSLLAEVVLPDIFLELAPAEVMRTWVACCSTGEDAYSVAILLAEYWQKTERRRPVKIFATDIDPSALDIARKGLYPVRLAETVGEERLRAWFHCNGDQCAIAPALREDIVFAVHDLLRDPPFLGMDLIVCRNFLIYLNADMQAKVISLFSHALRPGGYLLLGPAETIGQGSALFETVDKKWRLFRRKDSAAGPCALHSRLVRPQHPESVPTMPRTVTGAPDPEGVAEGRLLARYAHPAVLLDASGQVVRLVGDTRPYLELPAGAPSLSLQKLARKCLRAPLRTVVAAVQKDRRECVSGPVAVDDAESVAVNIKAEPILDARGNVIFVLVVFERVAADTAAPLATPVHCASDSELISHYETELERANDQRQRSIERYETLTEELKASNEELLSMNEELQTSNEELEASREELQSLNEELTSLNAELQAKIEDVARARSFVENLLAATNLATVVLDQALSIVRFTPAALALFHLIPTDAGRPLEQIKTRFDAGHLVEDCRQVLDGGDIVEREVETPEGEWFLQRTYPFRTPHGVVSGVVLTFAEVSQLKKAEEVLRRGNEELERIVAQRTEELREKIRLLDLATVNVRDMSGRITLWNTGCEELYGFSRQEAVGSISFELLQTTFPEPFEAIMDTLLAKGRWSGELRKIAKDGHAVDVAVLWVLNRDAASRPMSVLEVASDVSERVKAEEAVRDMARFPNENPNPVLRVGGDMIVGHANPASDVFLRANGSGTGQPFPDAYKPAVEQAFATGETTHFEARIGFQFFVFAVCPVLQRNYANIYGMNITDRKRAEMELTESEAKYHSLFDSMGEGVCLLEMVRDPEGVITDYRIIDVNPSYSTILGVPRERARGALVRELFGLDTLPDLEVYARVVATGQPESFDTYFEAQQKSLRVSAFTTAPDRFAVIFEDTTDRERALQELRKSEERLRQLVDAAPDAIIIQTEGRFTYLNPAAVRLFGAHTPEDLLGELVVDHIHPDSQELVRERIRLAGEGKGPLPGLELTYLRLDGTSVPVEAMATTFEYQGKNGSLVFTRDISERKREAEEKKLQITMNDAVARVRNAYVAGQSSAEVFDTALTELLRATGSRYGFIAELRTDDHGRPYQLCLAVSNVAWDEDSRRLYAQNAALGLEFHALDGLNAAAVATGEPVIANDPGRDVRASGRLPQGHPALEAFLGVPLFHGRECVGSIGLANREGGYDQELITSIVPLVDVCAQIIERLRTERRLVVAKQAAEAASLAKSEFLANMSHEIRTPLNGVLGMLQLMLTTPLDDEQMEYADNAVKSSKRLTRLLSDILDLSMVESGKLLIRQAPCSPADLRGAVIDLYALPAREKGLTLSVSLGAAMPEQIVADEVRLRQILFNLVGNAVKFTDHGMVSLDISPVSTRYDAAFRILVTVTDTGIGIPDAQIGAIFEPFGQVEGVYMRRFGGAGLGLSIVRRLVALMGGEICVDSEEGRGTSMYVSLPVQQAVYVAVESGRREQKGPGLSGLRLLLAEDDAVSMLSFTRMLQKAGYLVDVAEDGAKALALVAKEHYDCILMDVQMPVMDGVAATKAIRADEQLGKKPRVPIIAMTAYAMAGDRERLLDAGMDDYVGKPVDMEELEQTIQRVLSDREQGD
jgi:PAS domain S-box-containing protein